MNGQLKSSGLIWWEMFVFILRSLTFDCKQASWQMWGFVEISSETLEGICVRFLRSCSLETHQRSRTWSHCCLAEINWYIKEISKGTFVSFHNVDFWNVNPCMHWRKITQILLIRTNNYKESTHWIKHDFWSTKTEVEFLCKTYSNKLLKLYIKYLFTVHTLSSDCSQHLV